MRMHFEGLIRRSGVTVVVALFCMLLLPAATVIGGPSDAGASILGIGPKAVYGYVHFSDGVTPVESAIVTATVLDGTTIVATLFASTDSSGFYTVTFAPSDWNVDNLIIVGAIAGSGAGEGNLIADDSAAQAINITLDITVPEFELPLVSVVGMVVVMFTLVGRRVRR